MSALDDCHALAAVLYDGTPCDVQTRAWSTPAAALLFDADGAEDQAALLSATGPTPEAALAALHTALRAKAIARAHELLRAAGEPQPAVYLKDLQRRFDDLRGAVLGIAEGARPAAGPSLAESYGDDMAAALRRIDARLHREPAQRGVCGGARLDDGALQVLICAVLRTQGIFARESTVRVCAALIAAIREAERRADERHEPVEGVAEKVVRHVVAEGVASAVDRNVGRYGHTPVVDELRNVLGKHDGQRVRIVVEVLPEDDGAASHRQSIASASGAGQ